MRHFKKSRIVFFVTLLVCCNSQIRPSVAQSIKTKDGFEVERVYAVPRETQGSWVALTVDPAGRLITSDQKGSLYRVTLRERKEPFVEQIDLDIGHAHSLLYAFDSLYAIVAEEAHQGPGLYRIRDTDMDDDYDRVELLKSLRGTGEHGPHSVVVAPDKKSLFVVAGNKTPVPAGDSFTSIVPTHWGEDDLLPRLWGPIGSEAGTPAPGGWIAETDPEGKAWRLVAIGLRNSFDLAWNTEGELFTVDADAEFDIGTPWYQPTRLFHVVPGTDYGWRSGSGKWPSYYPDTLPPVVELGPGSPTGITFGHDTNFPDDERDALYVGDWSRGRIQMIRLQPHDGTFTGEVSEVVTGIPLPVTDLIANPNDGAIYFLTGGRGASSALYRLSHSQSRPRSTIDRIELESRPLIELRRKIESYYLADNHRQIIERLWPHLGSGHRGIRHAARLALGHRPPQLWRERAFAEPNPTPCMTALLALARAGVPSDLQPLIQSLIRFDWNDLSRKDRILLLRTLQVAFIRMSPSPHDAPPKMLAERYLNTAESSDPVIRSERLKLLVFLESASITEPAVKELAASPSQLQQLRYAAALRHQTAGWTPELRETYFTVLGRAGQWRGGLSLQKYIERIVDDALEQVPTEERDRYRQLATPATTDATVADSARQLVQQWTMQDLAPLLSGEGAGPSKKRGPELLAEADCLACHRFKGEGGGVGPDLTTVANRFTRRDMLEAIIEPDKVISDQFAASQIVTVDGRILTGRVVNLVGDALLVQTDMRKPAELERIPRNDIERIVPSPTSLMPSGLLDTFSKSEISTLIDYLMQPGN